MDNDIQVDFQILDTTTPPEEITELTGISPDVQLARGARNKKLDLPRQNIWSIRSKVHSNVLTDHWMELAEVLEASKAAIKTVGQTGNVKFTIIVNGDERVPSIIVPSEMCKFAGFVDAVIDVDHMQ